MKSIKTLFLPLFFIGLLASFTLKPESTKSNLCGPWINFHNYGGVTVEYVIIDNGNVDHEIFNLTPSNSDYSVWDNGNGWFDLKVKLAAGQNGSIKVYDDSFNLVACESTNSSTLTYRFQFQIMGCIVYSIVVSTDPC